MELASTRFSLASSQNVLRLHRPGLDGAAPHLVVGDLFLRSQWTASKKAAFQNLSVCLADREQG